MSEDDRNRWSAAFLRWFGGAPSLDERERVEALSRWAAWFHYHSPTNHNRRLWYANSERIRVSPHDGKEINGEFSSSDTNAQPPSVWHLHVTRTQLHPRQMQYFSTVICSHFCYVCGELIVKSALRTEIQTAVSSHYTRCRLFDDIPARRRR